MGFIDDTKDNVSDAADDFKDKAQDVREDSEDWVDKAKEKLDEGVTEATEGIDAWEDKNIERHDEKGGIPADELEDETHGRNL